MDELMDEYRRFVLDKFRYSDIKKYKYIINDKPIALGLVDKINISLKHLSDENRDDYDVVLKYITKRPSDLKYASQRLREEFKDLNK